MIKELEKMDDMLNHKQEITQYMCKTLQSPKIYDEVSFCSYLTETTEAIEKLSHYFVSIRFAGKTFNDELKIISKKQLNFLIAEMNRIKNYL